MIIILTSLDLCLVKSSIDEIFVAASVNLSIDENNAKERREFRSFALSCYSILLSSIFLSKCMMYASLIKYIEERDRVDCLDDSVEFDVMKLLVSDVATLF